MFGYLIVALLGYIGGRASRPNAATRPADASRWSGLLGDSDFVVWRNGAPWAWKAAGGSGAESSATAAMLQSLQYLQQYESGNGTFDGASGIAIARADNLVLANVRQPMSSDPWRWEIATPTNGVVASGESITRPGAVQDMLAALKPYTER